MTIIKNVTEEKGKKKLQSLIGFLSANKIDDYNGGRGEKNPKESTEQVKNKNNVFLESRLSETFPSLGVRPPHLPRMPSIAVLASGPAVGAAQVLVWSYFRVFLPPLSTAIRTSAFSFVGALSDLLYIP